MPQLQVDVVKTDITCYGFSNGTIFLDISGGSGGFSNVQWSNSSLSGTFLSTLPKGIYSYSIDQNNGCTTSGSVEILEPLEPITSVEISPILCHNESNGELRIQAFGGTPTPYRFQINSDVPRDFSGPNSTILRDIAASEFKLTLYDSRDCILNVFPSIKFDNPAPIEIEINEVVNPKGFSSIDGSITAVVSGGTLPYTSVNWFGVSTSNQIVTTYNALPIESRAFNLNAGSYDLVAVDANNCTNTINQNLFAPSPLEGKVDLETPKCFGENNGSIAVIATGGVPFEDGSYQYILRLKNGDEIKNQRDKSFTSLASGSYILIVRDSNGIEWTEEIQLIEPKELTIQLVEKIDNYCIESQVGVLEVQAEGGTPGYTYDWSTGQNTKRIHQLGDGVYFLSVKDANSCEIQQEFDIRFDQRFTFFGQLNMEPTSCPESCDGSFKAEFFGGFPPYSLEWRDFPESRNTIEVNGICGGFATSFVAIDSLGCISTSNSATISIPEPEVINLPDKLEVCPSNFQINANQDWGTSYQWTYPSGETINAAILEGKILGTYTIRIENERGCAVQKIVEVESNFDGELYIASPSVAPVNEPVVFIDLSNPKPAEIFWNIPSFATIIEENSERIIVQFNATGMYAIEALATFGACVYPIKKSVEIVSQEDYDDGGFSLTLNARKEDIHIFPNPVENFQFKAVFDQKMEEETKWHLLNVSSGLFTELTEINKLSTKEYEVPIHVNFAAGKYVLVVQSGKKSWFKTIILR